MWRAQTAVVARQTSAGTAAGSADTESDRATPAGRMQRVERLRLRCGVRGPDDVFLITAGSPGAGWSAYIPTWAPVLHSTAATRRVLPPGAGLPSN